MEDAPRTKRRRTESTTDATAEAPPLVRSAEYWFDDGNIILQAESTQFRVAKSVLSMHSSVFRDMFLLPLPSDEAMVEGCAVVVLQGDTALDWIVLLGVIYPKRLVDKALHPTRTAAILRLSKKYDFPLFREDCLKRLKTKFPTTLDEFISNSWPFLPTESSGYFTVISLAREIGIYSILPVAYTVLLDDCMAKILDPKDTDLSASDRLACLLGYANLLELQGSTTLAWLNLGAKHLPSPTCRQSTKCVAAVKDIIVTRSNNHPPLLYILDDWDEAWESGMCQPCRKKAKEVYEAGRETCWDKLPAAFGLPDWEELKSLDLK
ncbi:hypothetical protein B0H16DRAFT_1895121 [Mycena metata]|uniref:BTB domain-containing protein n=1 Tax=Mycena metata TaxID=1033252 RepID=A0AAD7HQR5_9AGAR|nr:hypothetical protein B0H16DRAFT_1895121 [Mycena metata]